MAVVDVLARLKADTSNFSSAMSKAQKQVENFERSANSTSSFLSKKFKFAFIGAATAVGAFAIKLGKDSVQAAQQAQAAQNRLRQLLLTTGGATEEQIVLLNKQAKALEALTVVSADNVTVVQSQLATFDLHASTIGMLTPAIIDYVVAEKGASASADTFRQMTNGLAQALNGQFASLTRTGFVIDKQTKQMISSGNENERAAAIVKVLNSTYKDFSKTAGTTAAGAQQKLINTVKNAQQAFGGALQPQLTKLVGFMSTNLVPIIERVQEKFANAESIQRFIDFIGMLLKNVIDFGKGVASMFEPVFTALIIPALKLAVGAVIAFIKALGAVGRFIQRNIKIFKGLVIVITAVSIGIAAYLVQVKLYNAATKIMIGLTAAKGKAIATLTKLFKGLNFVMKANPIGFIIGAVAALATGFVILWKKSDTFRKGVIAVGKVGLTVFGTIIKVVGVLAEGLANIILGPMKLFLKAMSFISPEAKDAYNKLKDFTNNVGGFFDKAAAKVEGYKSTLDKLAERPTTSKAKTKIKGEVETNLDELLKGLGSSDRVFGGKETKTKVKKGLQKSLADVMQGYNDFINNDFRKGFEGSAEDARDIVLKSTEEVKKVFDFMGKELSGPAAAKMKKGYNKLNEALRAFIPQAEANARALEEVTRKLEDAQAEYQNVLKARAEGAAELADILRMPFGEPSALTKALSSAEADVDSIISMYDSLVDAINKRYAGIDPAAAQRMLNFIEAQTKQLIVLAKRREKAVAVLEEAQAALEDVLQEQADFNKSIAGNLRQYATALVDLSKADSAAVYNVAKTATGYVISQIRASSSGIESITKQLQDRLRMITSFSANIKKLLASGLNQEYVRQLLEAGPETAALTAETLTSASQEQIKEINSLYSAINSASTNFGTEMATVFYGNAVSMAQAFVAGAQAEVENINAQMTFIKDSIAAVLAPLRDEGTSLGTDLALNMMNALESQRAALVAQAQSIADQIVATIAAAFAKLGAFTSGTTGKGGGAAPAPGTSSGTGPSNSKISKTSANIDTAPHNLGKTGVNVTINTEKVVPTVTSRTIANAISSSYGSRRMK